MIFNTQLLNGLPDHNLAKLLLFAIDQDMELDRVVDVDINLYQQTIMKLIEFGTISRTVERLSPYKLNFPIYVESNEEFDYDVQEFKNFFYIKSCGVSQRNSSPKKVQKALQIFMQCNKNYTWEDIINSTRLMVEEHKNKDSMPKDINFITRDEGVCLIDWIDQYKNSVTTKRSKFV